MGNGMEYEPQTAIMSDNPHQPTSRCSYTTAQYIVIPENWADCQRTCWGRLQSIMAIEASSPHNHVADAQKVIHQDSMTY